MNIINSFLNFIYPKRCILCGEMLTMDNEALMCLNCGTHTEKCKGEVVKHVGERLVKNADHINSAFAVYEYTTVRKGIENFKFNGCKNNGIPLADIMFQKANENFPWVFEKNDLIIAVPMHNKKKNKRGYNQAEVLAERISARSGIEFANNVLLRIANTQPQSELDHINRLVNIKNAFYVDKDKSIKGKRILLIDDIYTTGATLNECSRVLLKAGAEEVNAFTLSVTRLKKAE